MTAPASAPTDPRAGAADPFRVAAGVADPELPVVTIAELGILRHAELSADGTAVVTITPTYSGCPAMDVIRSDIATALRAAGFAEVEIRTVFAPAWTTDWITTAGRAKLAAAGIAPPGVISGPSAPPGAIDGPSAPPGAISGPSAPPGAVVGPSAPGAIDGTGSPSGTTRVGTTNAGTPSGTANAGTPAVRRSLPLLPPPAPACPHCGAAEVAEISRFGSTACTSLWRCLSCAEPFAHLKAH